MPRHRYRGRRSGADAPALVSETPRPAAVAPASAAAPPPEVTTPIADSVPAAVAPTVVDQALVPAPSAPAAMPAQVVPAPPLVPATANPASVVTAPSSAVPSIASDPALVPAPSAPAATPATVASAPPLVPAIATPASVVTAPSSVVPPIASDPALVPAPPPAATPALADPASVAAPPYVHSLARARQLVTRTHVIPLDFTRDIPAADRRLDSIARLLRLQTTVCAAVAFDETTTPRQLVIAANTMNADEARHINYLFTALSHLQSGTELTLEDNRALNRLSNQLRRYDYVLNIMDGTGTQSELTSLRDHYMNVIRGLESKEMVKLSGREQKKLAHARRSVACIDSRDLQAVKNNEHQPDSLYQEFLRSDRTREQRKVRDIAKLTEALRGMDDILTAPRVIITSNAVTDRIEPMDANLTYKATVHAEMQIAEYFVSRGKVLPRYMGISMTCCRQCSTIMNVIYDGKGISYRGESSYVFPNAQIPQRLLELAKAKGVDPTHLRHSAGRGGQEHLISDSDNSMGRRRVHTTLGMPRQPQTRTAPAAAAAPASPVEGGGSRGDSRGMRGGSSAAASSITTVPPSSATAAAPSTTTVPPSPAAAAPAPAATSTTTVPPSPAAAAPAPAATSTTTVPPSPAAAAPAPAATSTTTVPPSPATAAPAPAAPSTTTLPPSPAAVTPAPAAPLTTTVPPSPAAATLAPAASSAARGSRRGHRGGARRGHRGGASIGSAPVPSTSSASALPSSTVIRGQSALVPSATPQLPHGGRGRISGGGTGGLS